MFLVVLGIALRVEKKVEEVPLQPTLAHSIRLLRQDYSVFD